MHEGADGGDTLHINGTYRAHDSGFIFFSVIAAAPGSYRVNKPRRGFWRNVAPCDSERCPVLTAWAYNELEDPKTHRRGITFIIYGSFVNQ